MLNWKGTLKIANATWNRTLAPSLNRMSQTRIVVCKLTMVVMWNNAIYICIGWKLGKKSYKRYCKKNSYNIYYLSLWRFEFLEIIDNFRCTWQMRAIYYPKIFLYIYIYIYHSTFLPQKVMFWRTDIRTTLLQPELRQIPQLLNEPKFCRGKKITMITKVGR